MNGVVQLLRYEFEPTDKISVSRVRSEKIDPYHDPSLVEIRTVVSSGARFSSSTSAMTSRTDALADFQLAGGCTFSAHFRLPRIATRVELYSFIR